MSSRYFRLLDDVYLPGRWELGNPTDLRGQEIEDPWAFTTGSPVHIEEPLRIPIKHAGNPIDFSLAGLSIPVVHARVAAIFNELAPDDVQLIPVDIESQPQQYQILVATRLIRCIDDQKSTEVVYWKPEDKRPEKVGQYRSVYGMRIDPAKVEGSRVFRTWGWMVALIVSEEIKEAMECVGATGAKFNEV